MSMQETRGTAATARARGLSILLLLLSYGAVGARQPAVRVSVPLPVPADQLAGALGLYPDDRSHLLVSIVRLVFDAPDGLSVEDQKRRAVLSALMKAPASGQRDRVPLPLDASIWRETILQRPATEAEIASAILSDRSTALLYHGLAALDDDTLGWLGPDRETLLHLRRNAGAFAAFGRSVRVRAGRVTVPGGPDAEPLWAAIVGADPARPAAFVQRLIRGSGRLAWLYDAVLHLDVDRQRLVVGSRGTEAQRVERLRELLNVFESAAPEWQVPERPFVRPALDPSLVLSLVWATGSGTVAGPADRRVWDAIFREGALDPINAAASAEHADPDSRRIELAWLARRISLVPHGVGRRRLETFLFAQRVFPEPPPDDEMLLGALRGAAAFPALALTLERIGIANASAYAAAARSAAALNAIRSADWRRVSIAEFQSALAIVDRAARMGGIDRQTAAALVASLTALPVSIEHGFGSGFRRWAHLELARSLPLHADAAEPIEEAVLLACAGMREDPPAGETVEWEGRRYRVDPPAAELKRLRLVRARQRSSIRGTARGATSLDARLAAVAGLSEGTPLAMEQALAETLVSIVYAAYLGEAEGAAASADDVARRHDFGFSDGATTHINAWRLPREEHGEPTGWRVVGSLLGLDVALGRLALRRLDLSDMPGEPTMSTSERASAMLTAAIMGPVRSTAASRDEIAASIARGRERVAALRSDRADLDRVARDGGLSEWRRQALGWTAEHEPQKLVSRFSLVELFWLGSPRGASARSFDAWGTATMMLDGCLCLRMPDAAPWESHAGRAAAGHLATRGADVALRVAEVLAELKLPAALAPAIVAYAMQDAIDRAQPAFFDDWPAFERTARDLPRDRVIDYIAAVAADGAFIPLTVDSARH
jgi:hypothetical protein